MTATYQIKLAQFEGPFDLLLFFIERDELDIYNIPITRITKDFLHYIHQQEKLAPLSDEERHKLYHRNAERIFHIPAV